jgi:signal peptidase
MTDDEVPDSGDGAEPPAASGETASDGSPAADAADPASDDSSDPLDRSSDSHHSSDSPTSSESATESRTSETAGTHDSETTADATTETATNGAGSPVGTPGPGGSSPSGNSPANGPASGDDSPNADAGLVTQFRESESTPVVFLRETLSSALVVVVIGLVLFAISGIWPPMVAVESGSMEPHMQKGDLIFVTEPGRFAPDAAHGDTGIVTHQIGEEAGYSTFGQSGSVIVYSQPGRFGPPIIHRARFFVEKGENWYDRANPEYLPGDSCADIRHCPAPHAGFITKGDNNEMYDQVNAINAPPVKPSWVRGVARVRIPLLGWIRLVFSGAATTTPDPATVAPGAAMIGPDSATTMPDVTVDGGVAAAAPGGSPSGGGGFGNQTAAVVVR